MFVLQNFIKLYFLNFHLTYDFAYLLSAVLGLCCYVGFSLFAVSGGGGPTLQLWCQGLLIIVASLTAEHGALGTGASVAATPGSRARAQ